MSKVVFETIGNTIMFVLLGLLLTVGLTIQGTDKDFSVSANIFVLIFVIYMVIYGIVLFVWNKKQGAPFSYLLTGLQMHRDADEREVIVTCRAAKAAYMTAICTVPIALLTFVSAHFTNSSNTGLHLDMFVMGCWLFVLICIAINLAFSIVWCIEYKR